MCAVMPPGSGTGFLPLYKPAFYHPLSENKIGLLLFLLTIQLKKM
jgi:hypothetical protein